MQVNVDRGGRLDNLYLWCELNFIGQTPIMLAEDDDEMTAFLKNHLQDIQNTGPNKQPWRFEGAWHTHGRVL